MKSAGPPGGDPQRRLELAGTEVVPTAAAGAQLLSTHSVATCQVDQPDKQSAASADAPTELETIRGSDNLLIDGFIMPPGVLQVLTPTKPRPHNALASNLPDSRPNKKPLSALEPQISW